MHQARNLKEQLTPRSLVIGVVGALVITTSSMYVALRMGALPWPTIFVAVLSMTLLRMMGNTNLNEINTAHTAMSAGSMVAGGLAFTVPGIWMIQADASVSYWEVTAVALSGALLGMVFTALVRYHFIVKEELPFPMGIAASETVIAGDEGGLKARLLFSSMAATALFTVLRDWFGKIPGAWTAKGLYAKNIFFGFWISPMAIAIGYIIGPLFTGVWFLGALASYFVIIPIGVAWGWFADVAAATAFKDSLGIGLMVGTGIGILFKGILPKAKEIYGPIFRRKTIEGLNGRWTFVSIVLPVFLLTFISGIPLAGSLLAIAGIWLTTAMAASITGQTGINPMEIFGIIVLLAVRTVVAIGMKEAFFIAAVVAVACGLAGDVLNDFKSGHILGTDPRAQVVAEAVGGIVGALVSASVLFIMFKAYGTFGPGTELPAPQAYAVSTMVGGLPNQGAFFWGFAIGFALYMLNIPGMTLGLGIYLPMFISTTVFAGGLLGLVFGKREEESKNRGTVLASGILGGEGVAGVLIAIIKVLTMA